MNRKCSICNLQITNREERIDVPDQIEYVFIECAGCGNYKTTAISLVSLACRVEAAERIKPLARYILSHWIRKTFNKTNPFIEIDFSQIERIVESENLPNIAEQSHNLILFLGDNIYPYYSRFFEVALMACDTTIGAIDDDDLLYLQKNLYERGILRLEGHDEEELNITIASDKMGLSFKGWEKYSQIGSDNPFAELEFVISNSFLKNKVAINNFMLDTGAESYLHRL